MELDDAPHNIFFNSVLRAFGNITFISMKKKNESV